MQDLRRMQIGQIVDYCIAYNQRAKEAEKQAHGSEKRKATQQDINAFFG